MIPYCLLFNVVGLPVCNTSSYIAVPPTTTTAPICSSYTTCNSQQYEATPASATTDRGCNTIFAYNSNATNINPDVLKMYTHVYGYVYDGSSNISSLPVVWFVVCIFTVHIMQAIYNDGLAFKLYFVSVLLAFDFF
jgi:hypothetical protein